MNFSCCLLSILRMCTQVPSYPYYLANEAVQGAEQLDVTDKYSGQVAYRVSVASPEEISRWVHSSGYRLCGFNRESMSASATLSTACDDLGLHGQPPRDIKVGAEQH